MNEEVIYYLPIFDLGEKTEETSEATTEAASQELEYETTEGQVVDTRLYLSTTVNNADINDCYSMLLSIRNLFLLFLIIFLFFKVKTSIHTIFAKIFNVEK